MAATSGPRWRRRSGGTDVGECPKRSPVRSVTGPFRPYTYFYVYIGLGCVSNWAVGMEGSYVNL